MGIFNTEDHYAYHFTNHETGQDIKITPFVKVTPQSGGDNKYSVEYKIQGKNLTIGEDVYDIDLHADAWPLIMKESDTRNCSVVVTSREMTEKLTYNELNRVYAVVLQMVIDYTYTAEYAEFLHVHYRWVLEGDRNIAYKNIKAIEHEMKRI